MSVHEKIPSYAYLFIYLDCVKIYIMEDGFVNIGKLIDNLFLDIRYNSTYNFVGEKIDGYLEPLALGSKQLCEHLICVNKTVNDMGLYLKIYDTYRPMKAIKHFIRWANDINDIKMKDIFYPNVDKKDLFKLGYISDKSSHSRGSTVDLTLCNIDGKELDMGSYFDYFGDISHSDYIGELNSEQLNNRKLLKDVMINNGFKPIEEEWWHFTLIDEPFIDTYFDFDVRE